MVGLGLVPDPTFFRAGGSLHPPCAGAPCIPEGLRPITDLPTTRMPVRFIQYSSSASVPILQDATAYLPPNVAEIGVDGSDSDQLKFNATGTARTVVTTDQTQTLSNKSYQDSVTAITASGAIAPHTAKAYVITKAGVAAMTLAAPTATTDDGVIIKITSSTAFAHTITATGLLATGAAATDVATFNALAGASLTLMAYNAKWQVMSANGVSFS